jgi:hypothetical protein
MHDCLRLIAIKKEATCGSAITWDVHFPISVSTDISNPPGSIIHEALDFNNATGAAAGDDLTATWVELLEKSA